MATDELLRQVLGVYVAELREQAQRIAAALLSMERDATLIPTAIEELYRDAHSMKGSSASLGVTELEALAHQLESALTGVRRRNQPLTADVVDAGLRAMDAVQQRSAGLEADTDAGLAAVQAQTAVLQALVQGQVPSPSSLTNPPMAGSEEAPLNPALVGDDPSSIRLPAEQLLMLEHRTDELRTLHGRLSRHARALTRATQLLDRLSRELPLGEPRGGARVGRAEVREALRSLRALRRELLDDSEALHGISGEYSETLRALRLVAAGLLRQPMQRAVREACRLTGREVELGVVGDDLHLDRTLLEEIKNPLLHLLRNAVDHGIEPAAVRRSQGKPARGRIEVRLSQDSGQLTIAVRDDGRGIDQLRVRALAVARGLLSQTAADALDEAGTYQLLTLPGFSTAGEVTTLSGRGVGLDVVRTAAERLSGRLLIRAEPGRGATFTLSVPMTLVAAPMLLLEEPEGIYALPQTSVARIALVKRQALQPLGAHTVFQDDGEAVVVARLSTVLGSRGDKRWPAQLPLVLLHGSGQRVALGCERLIGESELILQPLPVELRRHRVLSAVALLPTGEVLLVLKPSVLAEAALVVPVPAGVAAQRTVLVADDSLTTRSLLRSVLESSGYKVRTAADGEEALRLLRNEAIDLLVSDVQMPRLDGIGLVERLRADPRIARLPVVLFSSGDSDDERRRGAACGADAYLTKGAFERGLLIEEVRKHMAGPA
jgi:chemotaxis protein histidine kinase CheA/CheY-like chemotaxis protein